MPLQVIGLEVVRYAGNHQLKMPKTSNPSDDVATWWREPILEEPKLLPSSVLHHLLTFPPTSCTSQQASELVQPRMTRAVRRDVRFTFTTQMIRMASSAPDSDASRAPPNRTAGQDRIFRRQRRVSFLLSPPTCLFLSSGLRFCVQTTSQCERPLSYFYHIEKQNSLNGYPQKKIFEWLKCQI